MRLCKKHETQMKFYFSIKSWRCPECQKEQSVKYRANNKDKKRLSAQKYYAKNTEKVKEYTTKWKAENPEKVRAHARKNYAKNSKNIKEKTAKWQKENPQKRKLYNAKYYTKNPEKTYANTHARRARLVGNGGKYTAKEWRDLCDYYGNTCIACGCVDVKLTVDHVVPLINGGENCINNIQPLCQSCNSSKGIKTIDYRK